MYLNVFIYVSVYVHITLCKSKNVYFFPFITRIDFIDFIKFTKGLYFYYECV